MADTYTSGSGANAELFALNPIASAWMMDEQKPGGLTWSSAVAKLPAGDDTSVTVVYDLEDVGVDRGQTEGRRGRNLPFETAEGGRTQTRSAILMDYGKSVQLDIMDATLKNRDIDQVGAERAVAITRSIMERRLATVLTAASTPWGVADQTESAVWSTVTTDIMNDLLSAVQTYNAAQILNTPPLNGIHMGLNVWHGMLRNTNMVTHYGGNVGSGIQSPAMVFQALSNLGFEYVTVGPHALYGGTVTLYSFGGPASNPSSAMPSGLVFAHQGGNGESTTVTVEEPDGGHGRLRNYLARMTGEYLVIPELGVRFDNVLA
jgi:hypothetical protein